MAKIKSTIEFRRVKSGMLPVYDGIDVDRVQLSFTSLKFFNDWSFLSSVDNCGSMAGIAEYDVDRTVRVLNWRKENRGLMFSQRVLLAWNVYRGSLRSRVLQRCHWAR